MMLSISEGEPVSDLGYRSALCPLSSSSISSANSLNGWGNAMTRTSYKVDLSSLCGDDKDETYYRSMPSNSTQSLDSWGHFVDTVPSKRH